MIVTGLEVVTAKGVSKHPDPVRPWLLLLDRIVPPAKLSPAVRHGGSGPGLLQLGSDNRFVAFAPCLHMVVHEAQASAWHHICEASPASAMESPMAYNGECGVLDTELSSAHACSPHFRSAVRALVAALEDVDDSYDGDLETVRNSGVPEALKQEVLRRLRQRHEECRAPYIRRLTALRKRMAPAVPQSLQDA